MAVNSGDTFVIPVRVEDLAAPVLDKISKAAAALSNGFKDAKVNIVVLNQAIELLGRTTRLLGSAFDVTAGKAIQLEKSVAEISTLMDSTTQTTAFFTAEILKLQSTFGTDQKEIARAYYEALSSGAVTASNSTQFLVAAQKLATGGVTDLKTTVDGLTSVLNAYGMSVAETTRVSDAFFIGAKGGKTTIGELSRELGQVAPLANATGLSMTELVGAISALTTGGIATNAAVTQVQSALVGLSKQTPQLTAVLDKLGVSNIKTAVASKGLVSVLKMIINETDGSTESLVELFGRVEAVQGILALTGKTIGSKYVDIMKEMAEASKSTGKVTEEAFQKMAKTTDYQMNVLKGKIDASLTRVGYLFKDFMIPKLQAFSDGLQSIVNLLQSFSNAVSKIDFSALAREADIIVLTLTTIAAAMAVVFKAEIATAIKTATILMQHYAKAVWAAAAPWVILAAKVLAVTAVVVAAVAAIEIVIRNVSKFGQLIEVVGGIFVSWGLRIERFFAGVHLSILKTQYGIAEGMNKIGAVSNETLANLGKGAKAQAAKVEELNASISQTSTDIAKAAEALDFGFSGEIIKQGMAAVKAFNGELGVTGDKAKAAASEIAKIVKPDAELKIKFELKADDKKALEDFVKRTKEMNTQIAESDMSQREIVNSRKIAALDEIKVLEGKLTAQKNLSKEGQAQLKQIQEYKKAVEATAGKDLKQKGLSGALGGGAIEAAGNAMGQVATTAIQAMNPVGMVMGAAEAIVGMIQKLIDFIPSILNAIANIFSSLADLPTKIMEAVGNVFTSITKFAANFIPNLIKAANGIFRASVEFLSDGLPNAISSMSKAIPELMTKIIDGLPDLFNKVAQGLIKSNPMVLVMRFWMGIIKGIPSFVKAFVKAMPEIVNEFANGFALAGKELINELSKFLGGGKIFDISEAEDKLKDLGDKLSRSTSQVFSVVDLEASARGLDVADRIRSAINSSLNLLGKVWDALKKIWDKIVRPILDQFIKDLKAVWKLIDGLWKTMVTLLQRTWNALVLFFQTVWLASIKFLQIIWDGLVKTLQIVWNTMISGLTIAWNALMAVLTITWNAITAVFRAAWDIVLGLFNNVIGFFQSIWQTLIDLFEGKINLLDGFRKLLETTFNTAVAGLTTVADFFKKIFETGAEAFQQVFDTAKEAGGKIWDGLKEGIEKGAETFKDIGKSIFNSFKTALDGIGDVFKNFGTAIMDGAKASINKIQEAFDQLNPANLFNKIFKVDMGGRGAVENAIGVDIPFMAFAQGGMVPGSAPVGGDSSVNDRILALLSPGEAIVPRSVMEDPFLAKLIKSVIDGNFKIPQLAMGGIKIGGTLGKVASGDLKGAASDVQGASLQQTTQDIQSGLAGVGDFMSQFDPSKLWDIIKDKVLKEMIWKMFEANKFATGGSVDTVPAMLTPGEFIVNRDSARANMGLLSQINGSNIPVSPVGDTAQTVNVTINAKTELSPEMIRREVLPTLEKELKKKSQQGRYIISAAGVRT